MIRGLAKFAVVVVLASLAANAQAQQPTFQGKGDHWLPWEDNNPYNKQIAPWYVKNHIDKELYDQWHGQMVEMANILASSPAAVTPDYWSYFQTVMRVCKTRLCGGMGFWSFDRDNLTFTPGKSQPKVTGETYPLDIVINRLGGLSMLNQMNGDTGPKVYGYLPEITERFSGYPVYDHRVFLMTPPGRQPFLPIPLGEALNAWTKNTYDSDPFLPQAKQMLASLSATDRARPAYLHFNESGLKSIVSTPGANSYPIMRYNPDYFDNSLPRWMIQSIKIDTHFMEFRYPVNDPTQARRRDRQLLEAADWKRVGAMLH